MKPSFFLSIFNGIVILLLPVLVYGSGNPEAQRYPYDLDDSLWSLQASKFTCLMSSSVTGLGSVMLRAEAGGIEQVSIQPDPFADYPRRVEVSLGSAPWKTVGQSVSLGAVDVVAGKNMRVNVNVSEAIRFLQQGRQLTIRVIRKDQPTSVIMVTALDIQKVAGDFYRCMDQLLTLNFKQAVHNIFYYPSNQKQLTSDQKVLIKDIADYLLADNSIKRLTIDAHTDSYGHELANRELSKLRAQAIYRYLMELGIPDEQILMRFHGERYPVADNGTAAGRDKNRRVEIWLKR